MKSIIHKLRVAVLFGGKSAEHEISVLSARNVISAIDQSKFELLLIGIDDHGGWHRVDTVDDLAHVATPESMHARPDIELLDQVDAVFPVLHGPMGEDGTIQGLLELIGMPYVGPDVLGSAVGMDKDIMKRLLRDADISVAPFLVITTQSRNEYSEESIVAKLGLPLFVKPANMGSSIGVSKVYTVNELTGAMDSAFEFDHKILIETAIIGDEIECAVLGNEDPEASVIGKIIASDDVLYSFDAKYSDGNNTVLEIPAVLPDQRAEEAKVTALRTFQVLGCEGMARVDMFATATGIVVNEINTIPGFTEFSMYPQLWAASGLSYTDLITRLIGLAIERSMRTHNLRTTRLV